MTTQIEIVPYDGIDKEFLSQIQTWVKNVLEKADPSSTPPYLRLTIWKNIKALQEFYDQEKEDLGIVTGEESDFLATHEAWRGYPRIHICHERVKGVRDAVIEGVLHHEIGHALFHGSMEFYTFKFTDRLQEAARLLGPCQKSLLEYMMKDTEEEQEAWGVAKHSPVIKKIAMAAFLKIILPIEALILIRSGDAPKLKDQWKEAYSWLSVMEQDGLLRLSQRIMEFGESRFQEKRHILQIPDPI